MLKNGRSSGMTLRWLWVEYEMAYIVCNGRPEWVKVSITGVFGITGENGNGSL